MIYHNSTDPVHVKKIDLRLWRLRDEIKSIVTTEIENKPKVELVEGLRKEYFKGTEDHSGDASGLELLEGGAGDDAEIDDGEAAMAAAIAGGDDAEDDGEAAMAAAMAGGDDAEDDGEAAMAAAIAEGDSNIEELPGQSAGPVVIKQRLPKISVEDLIRGKAFLSEIGIDKMFFFSSENLMVGQSVVVDFLVPKRFVLNARVAYSRPVNLKSRIISVNPLPYRVIISFTFLKEGERTLLRQFLSSVEPDIPEPVVVKPKVEEEEDDFADLDF